MALAVAVFGDWAFSEAFYLMRLRINNLARLVRV